MAKKEKRKCKINTGLWHKDAKRWGWDLIADDFYMCNVGFGSIGHTGYESSEAAHAVAKQYAEKLGLEIE